MADKHGKNDISQKDMMSLLDNLYQKCKDGIPFVSKPVPDMAIDYLDKYSTKDAAIKAMLNNQIIKCTTSGFVTGFGGVITLPVTIPANLSSVLYVQMRMIACTAYMAGYDLSSDQVQTFVYACLAGVSVNELLKKVGVRFGEKLAKNAIQKIPGKVCTKINQKIGMLFVTKFGKTGIVNLGDLIPGVGAVINGGFDLAETKIIANRAYKWFVKGDLGNNLTDTKDNDDVIEEDDCEVIYSSEDPLKDPDAQRAVNMANEKFKDDFYVVSISENDKYKMVTLSSQEIDKFNDGFDCPWLLVNKETGNELVSVGVILDPIEGFEDLDLSKLNVTVYNSTKESNDEKTN